jgi:hypothetical protein
MGVGRPLDGYPTSWGSSRASVFPHAGPAVYVAAVVATDVGDHAQAAPQAGMKYFDLVVAGLTDSGTYLVQPLHRNSLRTPTGAQQTTILLKWIVVATGVEVAPGVDLSAEVVRLLGIGPK